MSRRFVISGAGACAVLALSAALFSGTALAPGRTAALRLQAEF